MSVPLTGVGVSFGTFGELMQGALPGKDTDFLVTLPIARWSTAEITLVPGDGPLRVDPPDRHKALRLAELVLARFGVRGGGLLTVASDLPVGKGMASSSADLVATMRAVADALGTSVSPRATEDLLRLIEPTDGLMYHDTVAFYHRRVRLCRQLGSLPPMTIVGVDEGGQVDTVDFNAFRGAITPAERREYARLLDRLAVALPAGDLATVGAVATRSAVLNQARCPKPHLDQVLDVCRQVGALGVAVAHSGTMAGILVVKSDPDHARKVADAVDGCAGLGPVSVDETLEFAPKPHEEVPAARVSVK
ncbi:kinase [Labedaea rhizosphaerae]|uniref:Threonine kinase n=1 Tax=Labedaea rhizosphaerae TaxID=598644 RepID=A0A4R6S2S3_LABRH|nr:kinase [Labedaea rhizosphaerae]TDP92955.1 threonine kinase [Labedaea rhizosphaerae]